jgi:hypothetical protein
VLAAPKGKDLWEMMTAQEEDDEEAEETDLRELGERRGGRGKRIYENIRKSTAQFEIRNVLAALVEDGLLRPTGERERGQQSSLNNTYFSPRSEAQSPSE